jgi:L-alanine-DL-glutamate epimerase-like enolase superfamily enzyme
MSSTASLQGPLESALADPLARIRQELSLHLAAVRVHRFAYPVDPPMTTVFGTVTHRPCILVEVADRDGTRGFGEIWCNFPPAGAPYREALARDLLPVALGAPFRNPPHATDHLTEKLHTLALQAGEDGPLAQVIAGLDVALWDLVARRAGMPLFGLFGGTARVPVYASSIPPNDPLSLAEPALERGHRAFKLRIGFGRERDLGNLRLLRERVGPDARLMVDANQNWSLDEAREMSAAMSAAGLGWLEEPLPADRPAPEWREVAAAGIPLAGGENLRGLAVFRQAIEQRLLAVFQPDVGKWGGFSGGLAIGGAALAAGLRFCPHWLAGGIGLSASLHLQAALGGKDLVEFDANPNPLRALLCDPPVREGHVVLGDAPGLGVDDPPARLAAYRCG